MVVLQSAASIAEVAHANRQIFVKEVLEGSEFKSLVERIEEAALEGKSRCSFTGSSLHVDDIFKEALEDAGYKVIQAGNVFLRHLEISW